MTLDKVLRANLWIFLVLAISWSSPSGAQEQRLLITKQAFFNRHGWVALLMNRAGVNLGDIRTQSTEILLAEPGTCFHSLKAPRWYSASLPEIEKGFDAKAEAVVDVALLDKNVSAEIKARIERAKTVHVSFTDVETAEVPVHTLVTNMKRECLQIQFSRAHVVYVALLRAKARYIIKDRVEEGFSITGRLKRLWEWITFRTEQEYSGDGTVSLEEKVNLPQAYKYGRIAKTDGTWRIETPEALEEIKQALSSGKVIVPETATQLVAATFFGVNQFPVESSGGRPLGLAKVDAWDPSIRWISAKSAGQPPKPIEVNWPTTLPNEADRAAYVARQHPSMKETLDRLKADGLLTVYTRRP